MAENPEDRINKTSFFIIMRVTLVNPMRADVALGGLASLLGD